MTMFEFFISLILTILSVFALVFSEYVASKWYLRSAFATIILYMSYFAGLHGGVLK